MNHADFQSLTVFMRVAQSQSFTGAAHAMGISVSAASHTVRQMEQQLGARLFNRTTRSVSLTEAGQTFLQRIAPLMEELQLAMGDVGSASIQSMGTLRLNVPPTAVGLILKPLLRDFLNTYPEIQVDIAVDNSLVDIVSKGFDAGIRYQAVLAEDMVVVPLINRMRFCVVASPAYIASRGTPMHPRDLLEHDCVNYRSADTGALYRWEFEQSGNVDGVAAEKMRIAVKGRVSTNDTDLLLQAALDGFGFAYLMRRNVEPFVQRGELVRVLDGWVPSEGLYLYYYNRSGMPKKLRVFIDFVQAALRDSNGV
jgi:DNA-binding transcriptional LysR family regulator